MERKGPKVLLFDIGGVCVTSPFQAILDYEHSHHIPPGYINFAISRTSPNGTWHKLERGEIPLDANYYTNFKRDLENVDSWRAYHQRLHSQAGNGRILSDNKDPPVPEIDAEKLFLTMMGNGRYPDPYMYPALLKLKASGKYKLVALSNNVIFPPGHPLRAFGHDDVRAVFEIFIGSASIGMRKPERRAYEYAMRMIQERWGPEMEEKDVLFLDDIGENLKAAKALGMRTLKVVLGKSDEAVRELEMMTGLQLLGEAAEQRYESQEGKGARRASGGSRL